MIINIVFESLLVSPMMWTPDASCFPSSSINKERKKGQAKKKGKEWLQKKRNKQQQKKVNGKKQKRSCKKKKKKEH